MKREFKWTALLLAALLLTGCTQQVETDAPQLLEPAGVQSDMAEAYVGEIYRLTYYSASIKPYVEELSFNVSGEVMAVNGYPGMSVEEGDVLIELDQNSLQERAEQLQQNLDYMQKDNEYTESITELDIEILQTELRQLKDKETVLQENDAALKASEIALKEKETELTEKEAALKEQEAALKEQEAALKEQEAALKESEATPEASETTPEVSEATPETSEATPEESEATPEVSEATPETSEAAPEASETPPEESETAPEASETPLEESETAPEASETTPETSETTPEENETALIEAEIARVKAEIALAAEEIVRVREEIVLAAEEMAQVKENITLAAEEMARVKEEIALVEKEIALKENEITQKQAVLRQNTELQELDLENMRKELAEIRESMTANVLHAPFTGRIIYGDTLAPGSWVSAEDPVVFLADDSKLSIVCENIPETTIESADRIYAHIGAKEYELKYVPIDPDEYTMMVLSGAEVTTKFEIIASEEELAELEAGQYAQVCLWHDYVPDALLIPSNAVMYDSAGSYVYVNENGSRVKRSVKTGTATISHVQIVEGLEEGDVVYVKD